MEKRRLELAVHVACTGKMGCAYRILTENEGIMTHPTYS
jgi:hypothetical protein